MLRKLFLYFVLVISCLVVSSQANAQEDAQTNVNDWARWRGPTGNGIASEDQKPPVEWSSSKNVVWKTKIPGVGHSSPIVLGGKIFLTTADVAKQTQSVLCLDRKLGDIAWQTEINSCLLYTSPSPRDGLLSRMPSSA